MKRSKFNKIIDDAVELQTKYMEKINEILQDDKIIKNGGYRIDMLSNRYAEAGKTIVELQNLKANVDSSTIDHLFALNNADMFEEEEEE